MGARGYKPLRRQRASEQIEELIRREELWGLRLPGERELAAGLGVSRGTLQRALEALEARGVVVRRHGSGTFAAGRDQARRELSRVAVLAARGNFPAEGWSYYGDMIRGVTRGARRMDVGLEIFPLEECWAGSPGPEWGRLREFDAFIVVERDDPALMTALLKLRRGPVVILDSTFRDIPVVGVVDGSFAGARRAVSYLLRLGHRRVGFIGGPEGILVADRRTAAFLAGSERHGLEAHPVSSDFSVRGGYAACAKLMAGSSPTAICTANDLMAFGAMEYAHEAGIVLPSKLSIVGFDDIFFAQCTYPALTTVGQDRRKIGETAFQALWKLITEEEPSGREYHIGTELVMRDSTAPVAK